MPFQKPDVHNRLLSLLSHADLQAIVPHLEHIELAKGFQICEANQPVEHYYFMESGIGSIVGTSPEGFKAEVGLVGRDGILPTAAILGTASGIHDMFIQVAGDGHRIESASFERVLAANPALHGLLLRFIQVLATQATCTAL